MTCTTSSTTRPSSWWPGRGFGPTGVPDRPASTGWNRVPSRRRRRGSCRCCETNSRPAGYASTRARALHPQGRREDPAPRDRDRPRPHRAGSAQAAPGADLGGGLSVLLLRLPTQAAGAGRDGRDLQLRHQFVRVGAGGGGHGVLRRDRPPGRHGPAAEASRRQSASWRWSRRFSRPASSPRMASRGRPRPARPKAASSRRCWPTSPCRSSTIVSPRHGRALATAPGPAGNDVRRACPPTASCAMRTTSWCWWRVPRRRREAAG